MQAIVNHELLALPDRAALVFGLRWFPIVGSRVDALARRKAREARATHYVRGGTSGAAVGCARLRGGHRAGPHTYYSAAQRFAQIYPHGAVAGLLLLEEARTWLVAAKDGAVMARTDRIYPSMALATAALDELDAMHPGLANSAHHLVLDDFIAALAPDAVMQRVGLSFGRFPLPVRAIVGLIFVALILPPFWRVWRGDGVERADDIQIDAARAWRDAVVAATVSAIIHEPIQLNHVFSSLKALPMVISGWSLQSARCHAQSQDWHCRARYVRGVLTATNAGLAASVPAPTRVIFNNLEQADIVWQLSGTAHFLDTSKLSSASDTDHDFASLLQRLQPVFSNVVLGIPSDLAVVAPRDRQGQALPPPPDLPHLRQRTINLEGPLRSFSLLTEFPAFISWREVTLTVQADRNVTVMESPLMAQLQGVLYERE